ncbi:MAG: hypothetical protein ACREPM_09180 [Gemmatimonadaceae bacterium]
MATLTTLPIPIQAPVNQATSVSAAIAQANEDLVNGVVDNSLKSGATDAGTPDDALLQIAIWIVDTAGTIAQDALTLTQSAAATDAKAQQAAQCARNWAVVAALVAIIVAIVVAVITILSFGGAAPLVMGVIAAVAAIVSTVCTVVQDLPSVVQIGQFVGWSLGALQALCAGATPSDQARLKQQAVTQLRSAMTLVQSSALLHRPATYVDLNQSQAASDQTSRALLKLLASLRQRSPAGRVAVLVTELTQLAQLHGAIATQLKGVKR